MRDFDPVTLSRWLVYRKDFFYLFDRLGALGLLEMLRQESLRLADQPLDVFPYGRVDPFWHELEAELRHLLERLSPVLPDQAALFEELAESRLETPMEREREDEG